MATNAMDQDRSVLIGRIFSRAFGVMTRNPLVAFGSAFLFAAFPGALVSYFLQGWRPDITQPGAMSALMAFGFLGMVIGAVFQALVQGVLVTATIAESEGRRASFGEGLANAIGRVLPLVVVSLLFTLGVALGSVLLIVPGVILATMWAVAIPLVVAERSGIGMAFSRSAALTKGARWKIFGLFLILLVIAILFGLVVGAVILALFGIGAGTATLTASGLAFSAVQNTIVTTFLATMQTSLYVELRNWKDGPATQALDDIFG